MPEPHRLLPATTDALTANVHAGLPGLRTLRSATFRTMLALVLLLIGMVLVGMLLVRQASLDDGQFGIDFGAYLLASERMSMGQSPYTAEMLAGPISAQGVDRYLYPPLFAQLLSPLTALTMDQAAVLWLVVQTISMYAAVWVGLAIGGARRSIELALWCGVATVYFLPVFDTLWKGNVSGIVALSSVLVAVGGAAAGLGAAAGALLKVVPGTLVPTALAMDRRSRIALLVSLALGLGISFLLAPAAWLDYVSVLRNMLSGSTDYANNLAPGAVVARLGLEGVGADVVRALSLGTAAACVVGSVLLARTRAGRPAAALLGTIALLLVPASLWYHYIAILLPFAALAWPRARAALRAVLLAGAAAVTVGLAWLPLALAGAALMASASLLVVWPRTAHPLPEAE